MSRRNALLTIAALFIAACDSARNFWGTVNGFGGCMRCGDSWSWKPMQIIDYEWISFGLGGRGMFPLCKECFQECEDEEVVGYCRALWNKWDRGKEPFPEENIRKGIAIIRNGGYEKVKGQLREKGWQI